MGNRRKLIESNNKILRKKAEKVNKVTRPLLKLTDEMIETMRQQNGIGLAAPQLGISRQVIIARADQDSYIKLFNPGIEEAAGEVLDIEGCLSLPGVYGEVPRYKEILVRAVNEEGNNISLRASGLLARILQHEIDHLQGILFTDRAVRLLDQEEIDRLRREGDE